MPILHYGTAWSEIQTALDELPRGAKVIWLTYNAGAPRQVLSYCTKRRFRLQVICALPSDGVSLQSSAWHRYHETKRTAPLLGVITGGPAPDAEEALGRFHAKGVVGRSGRTYRGVIGSFNFSESALTDNVEVAHQLNTRKARAFWDEACALRDSSAVRPIALEECDDGEAAPPAAVEEIEYPDPPSVVGESPLADKPREAADYSSYSPATRRALVMALDEMLSEWPLGHPGSGVQQQLFATLMARQSRSRRRAYRDVLYLPVGLGKTFIALRWLLENITAEEVRRGKALLFLVPNAWIQQSVRRELELIISRAVVVSRGKELGISAKALEREARALVQILRFSEFGSRHSLLPERIAAIAADECHNWNPGAAPVTSAPATFRNYTDALNWLSADHPLPILGLSATPCRFNVEQFSVRLFVHDFCRARGAAGEVKPLKTLPSAIADGFLASPEFHPLLAKQQAKVKQALSAEGPSLEWGDYSRVTLARVWDVLEQHRTELLDQLLGAVKRLGTRKALIFLPPVGDRADAFVETLRERIEAASGPDAFVDFRAAAGVTPTEGQEIMRRFKNATPSPGAPMVVVTIDRVSEGVSVNDIDMLVMLRATLSPRIVVQSLGRGLRRDVHGTKTACHVLDAVGIEAQLEKWDGTARPRATRARRPAGGRSRTTTTRTSKSRRTTGGTWEEWSRGDELREPGETRPECYRRLYAEEGWTQSRIAKRFGVGTGSVRVALRGVARGRS